MYAVMGGFAVDQHDAEEPYFPKSLSRLTILPAGLRLLANVDFSLIPDISKEEISDKSKANGLAKSIVCVQAFWFCVQCITRLSQGLPITLLELNTFVHALCALLIYWLWWHKPLDVAEPTLIKGNEIHGLVALLSIRDLPEDSFIMDHKGYRCTHSKGDPLIHLTPNSSNTSSGSVINNSTKVPLTLTNRQSLRGFDFKPPYSCHEATYISLAITDITRINLASDSAEKIRGDNGDNLLSGLLKDGNRGIAISRRARNWPDVSAFYELEFFDGKKPKPVTLGFSLAGFVYGLLHLSAWGAPFPSAVQRLLWKLSSFTLVSSGIAIIVLTAMVGLAPRLFRTFRYRIWGRLRDFIETSAILILLLVVGAYSLLYIFVRICLVVECFLSLTHLPDAIFKVPQWSTYFPHIS
jgi:hypothetical protein